MLFAHIADTHLGYRQFNLEERELDFYRVFHEAVERMISEGVELVIHAGDLFDEPRPPIRALVEAKKGIEKLRKNDIKVVMIPGNHDMIMRRGSMAPHALFDGVEILTPQNPFTVIDDVFIGGVPYISKSYRDILLEKVKALEREASKFQRSILVLHQGIDKYLPYEHELEIGELPRTFSYYALGHVHSRIEEDFGDGVLCYPGSTEIWRVDEAVEWEKNGKGFLIADTVDVKPRRIDLEGVRPFLKREIRSEEEILSLKSEISGHKDPVVSITIQSDEDFNYLYENVSEELSKKAFYMAVRKKPFLKKEIFIKGGVLDVKGLIRDGLEGMSEDEKNYSYEVFKHLSKNEIESAITLTDDFYERRNKGDF